MMELLDFMLSWCFSSTQPKGYMLCSTVFLRRICTLLSVSADDAIMLLLLGNTEVMQTGPTTAASGSAYAEFGKTKVIVSVFGPRESKKAMLYSDTGRLNCSVSYTTFATGIRGQGLENKEYSGMLHKALEGAVMLHTFPKTTVDVFALVLESGGSDLPIIISCASLALADAGIMMYDLVTSVSVSCLGKNVLIDPTSDEEAWQDGGLMVSYMPARKEITQLTLTGEWTDGKITNAVELCMDACSKLCEILRERLKDPASLASE
uniref:Uncharacterized protein n=1 Tax=Triticum urartu TaxID=4572 RepID=A0A8R7PC17_TRIUA